jgi:GLPGLI family protein
VLGKVGRDTLLILQDWRIEPEMKLIAGYNCQKAIRKDAKGEDIIAWFTFDIPIPQGPDALHGLPGLILSVEAKSYKIIAFKIQILSKSIMLTMPFADEYLTLKALREIGTSKLMRNREHSKK